MATNPSDFERTYREKDDRGPEPDLDETTIIIDSDSGAVSVIDPTSGAEKSETDDGGVVINLNPRAPTRERGEQAFDDNLAEDIDSSELNRIADDLITAIESDDTTRREWLENRARGIDLLGFKLEDSHGDTGSSAAPLEGMSTVRHPLLAEAVIRFQSNAAAELLPAAGPVKVYNDAVPVPSPTPGDNNPPEPEVPSVPGATKNDLAQALEKDFNHFLTVTDKGYRPDTDRMLFWTGFGGCGFKKVYHDPIRRMPMVRSVDAEDLIVSNKANDIDDAGRVTHRLKMRKSQIKRMQLAGVYRDTELTQATKTYDPVSDKIDKVQGFTSRADRREDTPYTIYECYCELDIKGFEHRQIDSLPDDMTDPEELAEHRAKSWNGSSVGEITGLQVPYRVTIEKDSRKVLEIRRNWNEDDDDCLPRKVFVKYPFVPAFGFYEIGLLHILGNTDRALTGAWRLMLDSGMFSSFPGFLYSDVAGRQQTNEFRIPPGGGAKIQTGNRAIGDVVMPLPYKEPSNALQMLAAAMEKTAQRVGGTAEVMTDGGRGDMPVGTTLALIEQATKMLAAVHVRLHAAQSEEFQLLKERFKEDPEAFWRHNRRPARKWEKDEFLTALEDLDIVPAADPNVPSRMQRIMSAVAVKQLQQANPALYDGKAVDTAILRMIGINNPESLFNKNPQAAPPDPAVADAQAKKAALDQKAQQSAAEHQAKQQESAADFANKQKEHELRAAEIATESSDRAADRMSREKEMEQKIELEGMKTENQRAQHVENLEQKERDSQRNVSLQDAHHVDDMRRQAAEHATQTTLGAAEIAQQAHEHAIDTQQQAHEHGTETHQAQRHHDDEMSQREKETKAQGFGGGPGKRVI